MALLMVHLLVAQKWAEAHETYRDCPEFYLGAISPDAIHVRDKDDKSRKDEIHLYNWTSPHPDPLLAYWRAHHSPFDIGYGIHAMTDAQWVPRFRSRLPQIILPDGRVNTDVYYNDTFVTDFELYRDCGGEKLLTLLERGVVPEEHPLLTDYEIDEWRRMMAASYRGECPKSDPVKYINREYVEAFIEDSQLWLNEIWRRFLNE